MPGLSFLFKKKWHPARKNNEKKVWIKEQERDNRKLRDEEAHEEVNKEAEFRRLQALGQGGERDPRNSDLKFMYSQPLSTSNTLKSNVEGKYHEIKVLDNGDDELVVKFKEQLAGKASAKEEQAMENDAEVSSHTSQQAKSREEIEAMKKIKSNPQFGASSTQSALERSVGRKHTYGLSQSELEERYPRLKNAPMEGVYAKNVQIRHKPFNDVIRNVQCTRCREWGHQSGARECPLKDYNPHDVARQQREDPLTYMKSSLIEEKQRLILKHAANLSESSSAGGTNGMMLVEDDEEAESDPEADYLATLTYREKKLLLRRLDEMEQGLPITATYLISDSSSESSSSSSSSGSGSDEGGSRRKKKDHKKRRKSGKSSHKSSKKHKRTSRD